MFYNIKSIYFIDVIFSFFEDKRKLELVKYNKSLQKILNISITNYKFFSGRFIKYESKNKGIEYHENGVLMIYEGEFLNGKRNGKGVEYEYIQSFFPSISFEGEYLNGKRNGQGKEYNAFNGILIFEGKYFKGKRWTGKISHYKEEPIYELKEGNGHIKEYHFYGGKISFEGEYLNGERNGKGKEYDLEGNLLFEGEYYKGKRWNGKGYDAKSNIVYELKDGKGYVKEYYKGKLYFECEYANGEKNGKGKEYGLNKYEGEYLNGKRNGKGKKLDDNNKVYFEGIFFNGFMKRGKLYNNEEKLIYEGEFLYNKKWSGKGYDGNGNVTFEIINGNGKGIEYLHNNTRFEGEYINGKRNGFGKEYEKDGKLKFEGEFKDDKKIYKEIKKENPENARKDEPKAPQEDKKLKKRNQKTKNHCLIF